MPFNMCRSGHLPLEQPVNSYVIVTASWGVLFYGSCADFFWYPEATLDKLGPVASMANVYVGIVSFRLERRLSLTCLQRWATQQPRFSVLVCGLHQLSSTNTRLTRYPSPWDNKNWVPSNPEGQAFSPAKYRHERYCSTKLKHYYFGSVWDRQPVTVFLFQRHPSTPTILVNMLYPPVFLFVLPGHNLLDRPPVAFCAMLGKRSFMPRDERTF